MDENSRNLSLEHLRAELARVDLLVRRQARRWQLAGQNPADKFRGLHMPLEELDSYLSLPFEKNWGDLVHLPAEEENTFQQAMQHAEVKIEQIIAEADATNQSLRLAYLYQAFGLSPLEQAALLICLAPTLDLRYERIYGFLQDNVTRKLPSLSLICDLLEFGGVERMELLAHLNEQSALYKYHLLERHVESDASPASQLSQALSVDRTIVSWLLGRYLPHANLGAHARIILADQEMLAHDRLLAPPGWDELLELLAEDTILALYGPDSLEQEATARLFARHLERPLLAVDVQAAAATGVPVRQVVTMALRDARLTATIALLANWQACLDSDGRPLVDVFNAVCAHPDLVLLSSTVAWQASGSSGRTVLRLKFSIPSFQHREALWLHYLPEDAPISAEQVGALTGQFVLTSQQISDAVAAARSSAFQSGRNLEVQDLFAAARAHSNPKLGELARKIQPRFTWEDIVLPSDQSQILKEIVQTVRGRPLVLETWGVGKKLVSSAGITSLFAGPPGTGKTMAAEVIAAELSLDLYKIDLSTIVSKYIGETEKNLEKIFMEAQRSNAILFFDEADSIFGKRSEVKDAHDRYANIEVSYLLQRMEAYDGVTILATNLRANLDEAFTRRLQFAVDFPFPDEADRLRIWETLFPPDVPRGPDIDFSSLAKRFKLTGGSIRNIIIYGAYLAAADGVDVSMKHLLHGTRREMQKMGRLIEDADLKISN